MEEADEDNAGTALYAAHQTTLYCPPPVINGRIPKNVYGNLDVYAASMVPPGAAYLFHPETARAARVLGIDYADAVTGFAFKGRHGMAVTNGAVVAAEYKEAVEEVIEAFEDEKTREEEQRRIFEALRMWKRFLAGLRIRERIEGYEIEGERDMITKEEMEKLEEDDEGEEGGGFLPDGDAEEPAQPTAGKVSFQDMACTVGNEEGGFLADEDQDEENNLNNRRPQAPDIFLNGFINEDDDDGGGGGFVLDDPEDQDAEEALQDARVGEDSYESGNHEPKNAGPIDTASQEMLDHGGNYAQKELDREDTLNTRDSQPLETIHDVTHLLGNSRQSKSPEVSKLPDNLFLELHADELEKARILQQLHEAQQKEPLSLSQTAVLTDEGNGRPIPTSPTDGGDEDTGAFPDSNAATASSMGEEKQDITLNSSESDRGSLLSQDPDDEDANPEWLE